MILNYIWWCGSSSDQGIMEHPLIAITPQVHYDLEW